MSKKTNKQFNWKAFVSVLIAMSFIGMTFTGVILFVVPPGRIANWTGWTLLALTKRQWIGLHIWLSIIFMVASAFHVYLNWKLFVSYFKSKVSKAFALRTEWILAMLICAAVFLGTLADLTPFSSLLVWNENIKHSWDNTQQRAPIPHAELLTITELAEQVRDVDLDTMLTNLKAKGIEVESTDVVLGKLAEACNMTPARLYDLALGQAAPGRGHGAQGRGGRGIAAPGGGLGRHTDTQDGAGPDSDRGGLSRGLGWMTLKEYCDQLGLDVNTTVKKLQDAGFKAGPDMTIRAIADTTGVHPSQIRTIIEPQTQ